DPQRALELSVGPLPLIDPAFSQTDASLLSASPERVWVAASVHAAQNPPESQICVPGASCASRPSCFASSILEGLGSRLPGPLSAWRRHDSGVLRWREPMPVAQWFALMRSS